MSERESGRDGGGTGGVPVDRSAAYRQARPMPAGMRVVFTVVLLILSLSLTAIVVDRLYTEHLIASAGAETRAVVTQTVETRGRSGRSWYLSYSFDLDGRTYGRTALFGLFPKRSRVTRITFESVQEGSSIPVVYAKDHPASNRPAEDPFRYYRMAFLVAGALAAGLVSLNELRNFLMRKRDPGTADRALRHPDGHG